MLLTESVSCRVAPICPLTCWCHGCARQRVVVGVVIRCFDPAPCSQLLVHLAHTCCQQQVAQGSMDMASNTRKLLAGTAHVGAAWVMLPSVGVVTRRSGSPAMTPLSHLLCHRQQHDQHPQPTAAPLDTTHATQARVSL
jgi:hypothetical protein